MTVSVKPVVLCFSVAGVSSGGKLRLHWGKGGGEDEEYLEKWGSGG
jgi:hypothetical protein